MYNRDSAGETSPPLEVDPSAALRGDAERLAALSASPDSRFVIFVAKKPVIKSNAERTTCAIRWFSGSELVGTVTAGHPAIFLGRERTAGGGCFAVALPDPSDDKVAQRFAPAVDFRSLVGQGTMSDADLAVIGTAKSLMHWHDHARFCGACGSATSFVDGGWKRVCSVCAAEWFPRVDPVVIMLLTDGDNAVLAREPHFPPGMYSALAGFIEPGETIEQAVARETQEEVGVAVRSVTIVANQPWPMPHSLMIGCRADAEPGARLTIDGTEIEDARWFPRDAVAAMLAGRHVQGLWLPPPQAIANRLIRDWLAQPLRDEVSKG